MTNASTASVPDATKRETKLLERRGWHPVVHEKIVDYYWEGSRRIPVLEIQEIVEWTHPDLEWPWLTADAVKLEGERTKRRPDVLALFRPSEKHQRA